MTRARAITSYRLYDRARATRSKSRPGKRERIRGSGISGRDGNSDELSKAAGRRKLRRERRLPGVAAFVLATLGTCSISADPTNKRTNERRSERTSVDARLLKVKRETRVSHESRIVAREEDHCIGAGGVPLVYEPRLLSRLQRLGQTTETDRGT